MKRKGWSDAKIARAVEDRRKADAKPSGGGTDSLELWNAVLIDLKNKMKLSHAGLFVRFYSGDIATEKFTVSRRLIPKKIKWLEALASLEHDEVTVFQF